MYYIKPINKEYLKQNENEYFNIYLDKVNASESSSILNLNGIIKIISNAKLPNFSYFLSLESSFGQSNKINLNLIKSNEIKRNEETLVREEYFNFDIFFNLSNTSQFNSKVCSKNVYFKFIPILNQNVITDFKIPIDNSILYNFVHYINCSSIYKESVYSNAFKLDTSSQRIDLAELKNISKNNYIYFFKNYYDGYPIIYDLFSINFDSPFKIEQCIGKITYISNNKMQTIDLALDIEKQNNAITIKPRYWYFYNNSFEIINDNSYGISTSNSIDMKLEISIIAHLNNTTKYFDFEDKISFNEFRYYNLLNKVEIIQSNDLLTNYSEVQNYEIF